MNAALRRHHNDGAEGCPWIADRWTIYRVGLRDMPGSIGRRPGGCNAGPARDRPAPLVLTLCNECGEEIASATAPAGEAAIKSAIMLLARSETLRVGYRLTVLMGASTLQS